MKIIHVGIAALIGSALGPSSVLAQQRPSEAEKQEQVSTTHVEIHHRFDGLSSGELPNSRALLLTFEHYSEQSYGDQFFFFDILGNTPDQGRYLKTGEMYFRWDPRFSIPRIFNLSKPEQEALIQDYYFSVRLTDVDVPYINQAFMLGGSIDLRLSDDFIPVLNLYARKAEENRWAPMLAAAWQGPFTIFETDFRFKGFFDFYRVDEGWIFHTQPQLLLPISKTISLGTEHQISRNLYSAEAGWVWLPTLLLKVFF